MAPAFRDEGIGGFAIAVRLAEVADRLRDLAAEAEESNKISDAVKASLAEARTLDHLLSQGARSDREIDFAKDAAALEKAVAALVRQLPNLGDQIADELDRADRPDYAAKARGYAVKCRELPEHQPKPVSTNKEVTHAEH